jgi:hypothetical protein
VSKLKSFTIEGEQMQRRLSTGSLDEAGLEVEKQ